MHAKGVEVKRKLKKLYLFESFQMQHMESAGKPTYVEITVA